MTPICDDPRHGAAPESLESASAELRESAADQTEFLLRALLHIANKLEQRAPDVARELSERIESELRRR
jgi:hypothetical protein